MGKCETSTASIGIIILLSDLILQINEKNVNVIIDMILEGFISDMNEQYNEMYLNIIHSNELPKNHIDCKNYLEKEFKKGGLFDKELLLPIKQLLQTERWGYDRYGTNSNYRPLDFDLSVDLEKYKEIEHYRTVFMLEQHSG